MRRTLLPAAIVTSAAVIVLSVTTAAFAQPQKGSPHSKIVVGLNRTRPRPAPCIPSTRGRGHGQNCPVGPCPPFHATQRCIVPPPPHRCIYPAVWVDGRCIILRPPPPPPLHRCIRPEVWIGGRCVFLRPQPPRPSLHKCAYPAVWIGGRCVVLRTPHPICRNRTCV